MATDRVYIRDLPRTDRRLGRRVRHDDRSRSFAFNTSGLSIVTAWHTRRIDVLDQGDLGSCTGNAGIGCLGTDPYYATFEKVRSESFYAFNEYGAVDLYSDATKIDPFAGEYPPTDSGSDGNSIAQALKTAGMISGYRWTFSLDDALKALGVTPFITGTEWLDGMFYPDSTGRVRPTGGVAGGHEYVVDGIDAEREQVWCTNSWGSGWSLKGRFWMSFADYGTLLSRQGDVTIFTPLTEPAPTPPPDPDTSLADVLKPWCAKRRYCPEHKALKAAGLEWLAKKGL